MENKSERKKAQMIIKNQTAPSMNYLHESKQPKEIQNISRGPKKRKNILYHQSLKWACSNEANTNDNRF